MKNQSERLFTERRQNAIEISALLAVVETMRDVPNDILRELSNLTLSEQRIQRSLLLRLSSRLITNRPIKRFTDSYRHLDGVLAPRFDTLQSPSFRSEEQSTITY